MGQRENIRRTPGRGRSSPEITPLAQCRRLVGAAEGGEDIGGGFSGIPGPVMIFSGVRHG
jgi:hypothetical protein